MIYAFLSTFNNYFSFIMVKCPFQIDPKRCFELAFGTVGIYLTYLFAGVFHEYMITKKYRNRFSMEQQSFTWGIGFLIFPTATTWIIGQIVNCFTIEQGKKTIIPAKKSIVCALTVGISTITYTYAIYWTNFPIVMMVKSCNILSVVLVGVLCSRVRDDKLKLGSKKIIVGVVVTLGIILFKYFDPQNANKNQRKTEIFGIVLLIISLLADGFLPDFQAEIKSVYKPRPMQMMTEINKWVCIMSLIVSVILNFQIQDMVIFIHQHYLFAFHLLAMGLLSTIGQMFVYRMIKQFKQHIVPFIITTRKILTVGLSIIYFKHQTNIGQILGIFLVFGVVTFQFIAQLKQAKKFEGRHQIPNVVNLGNIMTEEINSQFGKNPTTVDSQIQPNTNTIDNSEVEK